MQASEGTIKHYYYRYFAFRFNKTGKQAQDEPSLVSDSRTCFGRVWFKKYKDVFFNKG